MKQAFRFKFGLLSVCCVAALYGCGGGGGDGGSASNGGNNEQSNSQTNGDTPSNSAPYSQADGTVLVSDKISGSVFTLRHKLTLDDSGRAVAMWMEGDKDLQLMAVDTDAAGMRWNSPQRIATESQSDFDLTTNRAGQRVALELRRSTGTEAPAPRLHFYRADTGWAAPVSVKGNLLVNSARRASLTALEDDGSATLITRGNATDSFKPSFEASRVLPDGTQNIVQPGYPLTRSGQLLTNGTWSTVGAAFAVAPRTGEIPPHGYLVWQNVIRDNTNITVNPIIAVGALGTFIERPAITMSATNLNVLDENHKWLSGADCPRDLLKAASVDDRYTVALSAGVSSSSLANGFECSLNVTRIDRRTVTQNIKTDALSAPDASVDKAQLMVDRNGNALVVWHERSRNRYMWSQSLAYGNWSSPADLSSTLALAENILDGMEIKLNDQGQAVAALETYARNPKESSFQRNLAYARFDFQNGWGKPSEIATFTVNGNSVSALDIDVAINHAGKAMVTYLVPRCYISQKEPNCSVSSLYSYSL